MAAPMPAPWPCQQPWPRLPTTQTTTQTTNRQGPRPWLLQAATGNAGPKSRYGAVYTRSTFPRPSQVASMTRATPSRTLRFAEPVASRQPASKGRLWHRSTRCELPTWRRRLLFAAFHPLRQGRQSQRPRPRATGGVSRRLSWLLRSRANLSARMPTPRDATTHSPRQMRCGTLQRRVTGEPS